MVYLRGTLLAFFFLISCVSAQDIIPCRGRGRGRHSSALHAQFDDDLNTKRLDARNPQSFQINTYVHVIATTKKSAENYPISMVNDQIDAMSKAFAPSFTFSLISADFTVHDVWATHGGADDTDEVEMEYKRLLKKGHNYGELDLYFLSDLGQADNSTLLGVCFMPGDSPSQEERILDGCTILAGTMPGGETERYNLGATSVHETGHWLGLYHTFEGDSCNGPGDYVSDTPTQRVSTDGCPAHQDTCPGSPGLDATYNYMDYSDDRCLSHFTPLQRVRMLHSYSAMRWKK